jgi:LysM repeat protein
VPVGRAEGFDSAFAALDADARAAYRHVEAKKGQTFASLAASNGLSVKQLKWYNPKVTTLKSGRLRTGEELLVPTRGVVIAALDVPDPSIEIYGSRGGTRTYVVKRGETLGGIAKKTGTSVSALMRMNGLKKAVIHPGQELVVRGSSRHSSVAGTGSKSASKSASAKSRTTNKSTSSNTTKATTTVAKR